MILFYIRLPARLAALYLRLLRADNPMRSTACRFESVRSVLDLIEREPPSAAREWLIQECNQMLADIIADHCGAFVGILAWMMDCPDVIDLSPEMSIEIDEN